mgnify:CR=1 FL=1
MLANIKFWENKAKEGQFAIPHFNVWNAEMLMGVIDAAEEENAPIIISFGTGFVGNTVFEGLLLDDSWLWPRKPRFQLLLTGITVAAWKLFRMLYPWHELRHARCFCSAFRGEHQGDQDAVDYFHPLGVPVEADSVMWAMRPCMKRHSLHMPIPTRARQQSL